MEGFVPPDLTVFLYKMSHKTPNRLFICCFVTACPDVFDIHVSRFQSIFVLFTMTFNITIAQVYNPISLPQTQAHTHIPHIDTNTLFTITFPFFFFFNV